MVIYGKRYTAEEAYKVGLVDAICDQDELIDCAVKMAKDNLGEFPWVILCSEVRVYSRDMCVFWRMQYNDQDELAKNGLGESSRAVELQCIPVVCAF